MRGQNGQVRATCGSLPLVSDPCDVLRGRNSLKRLSGVKGLHPLSNTLPIRVRACLQRGIIWESEGGLDFEGDEERPSIRGSAVRAMQKEQYDTDLIEAQWQRLQPLLPRLKRLGHPRAPLRQSVNALLYAIKTGCQWRLLPKAFPPWPTVCHIFRQWSRDAVLASLNDRLRARVREQAGKDCRPTRPNGRAAGNCRSRCWLISIGCASSGSMAATAARSSPLSRSCGPSWTGKSSNARTIRAGSPCSQTLGGRAHLGLVHAAPLSRA